MKMPNSIRFFSFTKIDSPFVDFLSTPTNNDQHKTDLQFFGSKLQQRIQTYDTCFSKQPSIEKFAVVFFVHKLLWILLFLPHIGISGGRGGKFTVVSIFSYVEF